MTDANQTGVTLKNPELDERIRQYVESGELPGLVYFVERGGEQFVGAAGERILNGAPMSRDTIVRISSMSKPIAAAVALMLIEEGVIGLDQPIESVLPELANMRVLRTIGSELHDTMPLVRAATVEDLLTFRLGTGIVLETPGTYPIQRAMDESGLGIGPPNPSKPPNPDEWIRRFAELPLIYQPGESWMYVSSSEVLGVLLARASGQPLPDLFDERLFGQLGMADTGFHVPAHKTDRFTLEYVRDTEKGELSVFDPAVGGQWNQSPAFPSAGGGLVSTVVDFAAFARMLLRGGVHKGKRILSEKSVQAMTSNHLTDRQRKEGEIILGDGNGWGYGMAVRAADSDLSGVVGSYGWNGGLGTTWLNDPANEMIAIVLTQVHWTSPSLPAYATAFLDGAYRICQSRSS